MGKETPYQRVSPSVAPWQAVLIVFLAMLIPGCGGCWSSSSDEEAKKKKEDEELDADKELDKKKKKKKDEEKKKDFEYLPTVTLPEDEVTNNLPRNYVRRGHWVGTRQLLRANNFDYSAVFETRITDPSGEGFDVDQTSYTAVVSRPAKLPKGQDRPLESLLLIPRQSIQGKAPQIHFEVAASYGGSPILQNNTGLTFLEEPEYIMLVLASRPSQYSYFTQLDSVRPPGDTDTSQLGDSDFRSYRVLRPNISKGVTMPPNSLMWTTVAVIVWDDVDPTLVSLDQQQAMIDWLHFGGQIIINGPSSLGQLKGSFLDPYLPADDAQSVNLDAAALEPLNKGWTIQPPGESARPRNLNLVKDRPILGCELAKRERGTFLPNCGNLVAESRVGRGRVVVTGFSLSAGAIKNWRSFDNFFNACLLRRSPRQYYKPTSPDAAYLDTVAIGFPDIMSTTYSDGRGIANRAGRYLRDPRMNSNLRYFTRDVGWLPGEDVPLPARERSIAGRTTIDDDIDEFRRRGVTTGSEHPTGDSWRFGGFAAAPSSGVAGWNDFSGATHAARLALQQTARIKVPNSRFVLNTLGLYLLVLVPINWGFFRLIGRVEWAWVAAPLIALGGAYTVIRMAELDIGFARSRTEINVVEMQDDYDRAHVTRFTALYTSLSSDYDMVFADESALVAPMAFDSVYVRQDRPVSEVHFRRDQDLRLSGLNISSNTTSYVHSEQIIPMGGPIQLVGTEKDSLDLHNGTILSLRDVVVIRCTGELQYEAAYVEKLGPGEDAPLRFDAEMLERDNRYVDSNKPDPEKSRDESENEKQSREEQARRLDRERTDPNRDTGIWPKPWRNTSVFGEPSGGDDRSLRLTRLARLAVRQLALRPGDSRLIAWSDEELPGVQISPSAAQQVVSTFVLAHLKRSPLPDPKGDLNCRADIVGKEKEDEKEDDEFAPIPIDDSEME